MNLYKIHYGYIFYNARSIIAKSNGLCVCMQNIIDCYLISGLTHQRWYCTTKLESSRPKIIHITMMLRATAKIEQQETNDQALKPPINLLFGKYIKSRSVLPFGFFSMYLYLCISSHTHARSTKQAV